MQLENIHVAIVEDDHEIRQTLALIIDGTPGFWCKHTFENGQAALKPLLENHVDVVLMDIEMPQLNGIDCVRRLKPEKPQVDFIMLTIRHDDEAIFQSICAGASGYLLKDTPPAELLQSIKEVKAGGAPMSASIARRVIQSFHPIEKIAAFGTGDRSLTLLAQGMNYRSVAEQLFLSPHTVKTHIKNIYEKLQVNSRAAAIKKGIEDRLI
ncbi:MAG: response regulator transcription factor [Saprospiraceae bacterium]